MAHHYILPTIENYNPDSLETKIEGILGKQFSEWLSTESSDTRTKVYQINKDSKLTQGVVIIMLSKSNPLDLKIRYNDAIIVTKSRDITTANCDADDPYSTTGCGEIYVSTPTTETDEFNYLNSEFRKVIQEM